MNTDTCASGLSSGRPLLESFFFLSIPGRSAFIGIGFQDRADSFDLSVTMQDHFK